jgi:hypothetical protein
LSQGTKLGGDAMLNHWGLEVSLHGSDRLFSRPSSASAWISRAEFCCGGSSAAVDWFLRLPFHFVFFGGILAVEYLSVRTGRWLLAIV